MRNFTGEQVTEIINGVKQANYFWIFLSLSIAVLSHISRAMRWRMLIAAISTPPRLPNTFFAVMVGYLANLALPRLGEVTRCGVLTRYEQVPFDKAAGTVISERAIDLVTLLLLTFLAVVLQFDIIGTYFIDKVGQPLLNKFSSLLSAANWLFYVIAVLVLLGLVVFFLWLRANFRKTTMYKKITGTLFGVWQGIESVKKVDNMPLFIFHSIFIWVMYFLMIYTCFFSMEATRSLGFLDALAVLSFGSFGIIATQGGIGAYQIIVSGLLLLYGIAAETAMAFSWLVWSAQTALILVGGALALGGLAIVGERKQ